MVDNIKEDEIKRYGIEEFFRLHSVARAEICRRFGLTNGQTVQNWLKPGITYFFEHNVTADRLRAIKAEEVMHVGKWRGDGRKRSVVRYEMGKFIDDHGFTPKAISELMGAKYPPGIRSMLTSTFDYYFEHDERAGILRIIKPEQIMHECDFVAPIKAEDHDRSFSRRT